MATVHDGKLFSCGNHSLEITKGMLHFGDPNLIVCILRVPTTMNVRDIIQFLNPAMPDIENTRIVRGVNHDAYYTVLLQFRLPETAKEFYQNYDGKPFNSLEENICKLLYVTRVETFSEDPAKTSQASNCAVCLDMMYPDVESIITILCNHSFHVYCLSQWKDTSCPVCRYCQTPENQVESKCMDCSYEGESLWMCIICGYVACGRYINGHAYDHFSETQHTYAMQLTDNQVWDYAGDNYVHRLLANKSDGKPVEVEGSEAYRQSEEKIEAVQLEFTYLLTQQLESQRKYYERCMKDCEKQALKKVSESEARLTKAMDDLKDSQERQHQLVKDKGALDKKLNSMQKKLAKLQVSYDEEKQHNKCLTLNQEQFQKKIQDLEEQLEAKSSQISDLEEQQRDLMFFVEAREKLSEQSVLSETELNESQIGIVSPETSNQQSINRRNNRRKKK